MADRTFDRWDQKPALGRRGMAVALLGPLLLAAAGFGVVSWLSEDSQTQASVIRVPTSGWIPGQQVGQEPIQGTLQIDEHHCVYLDSVGGQQVWPVWPAGYNARLDDSGRVSLYDGADDLVAHDGDEVQATGSHASSAAYAGEPCLPADDQVAVVQSQVSVVR